LVVEPPLIEAVLATVRLATVPPSVFVSEGETDSPFEPVRTVVPLVVLLVVLLPVSLVLAKPDVVVVAALVMLMLPVVEVDPGAVEVMVSSPAERDEQTAFPAL
jgi:hypothetical protein